MDIVTWSLLLITFSHQENWLGGVKYLFGTYLFGTMITGFLLIGTSIALDYRKICKTAAIQGANRLPDLLIEIARAVGTLNSERAINELIREGRECPD